MPRARLVALLALPPVFALALTACSSPAAEPDHADVRVELAQFRSDYAARVVQLRVVNEGAAPVTVIAAELDSDRLGEAAEWEGDRSTIPAGGARDLPVRLPAPECAAPESDPVVTLRLQQPTESQLRLTPTDPLGVLEGVLAKDCLDLAIAERVTVTPADSIRTEQRDGRLVALLDLRVEPTAPTAADADESTDPVVHAVRSTVMLQPAAGGEAWVLDAPVTDTFVVTLDIVPARCDPHVVAEDKVGTRLPIEIDAGDEGSGTITVPVSDEVRGQLYDFVAAHCGWPAS